MKLLEFQTSDHNSFFESDELIMAGNSLPSACFSLSFFNEEENNLQELISFTFTHFCQLQLQSRVSESQSAEAIFIAPNRSCATVKGKLGDVCNNNHHAW